MSLPILSASRAVEPADLVRFFHRARLHWTRHLADEATLDVGSAFMNPELSALWEANRILDAVVPDGLTAEQAIAQGEAHFAGQGARCLAWTLNPSAPTLMAAPLAERLIARGWTAVTHDIMRLNTDPAGAVAEGGAWKIIPARASYRHARALAQEQAAELGLAPGWVEACVLHMDDSHWDALLALGESSAAAAKIGVLAVGEIGLIEDLYVSAAFRRRGLGRTMFRRAMEICARSLFKHVLAEVDPANAAGVALLQQAGFSRVGAVTEYRSADPRQAGG